MAKTTHRTGAINDIEVAESQPQRSTLTFISGLTDSQHPVSNFPGGRIAKLRISEQTKNTSNYLHYHQSNNHLGDKHHHNRNTSFLFCPDNLWSKEASRGRNRSKTLQSIRSPLFLTAQRLHMLAGGLSQHETESSKCNLPEIHDRMSPSAFAL